MPAGDDVTVPPPAFVTVTCAVPVPWSDVLAVPAPETVSDTPVFAPTDAGVNLAPIEQLALGPSVDGHEFDEIMKSMVFDSIGAPRVPVAVWPVFVSVNTVSVLMPPTATAPKSFDAGDKDSAPAVSAVPVSDEVGLPPWVAVTVKVAGFAPAWPVGLKRTVTVHVAPGASCALMQVPPVTV